MRYILLCSLMMIGCGKAPVNSAKAYTEYLMHEKNGLKKIEIRNGTEVTALCQPADLMTLNELEAYGDPVTQAAFDSVRKKYINASCFTLSFSKDGKEVLDMSKGYGEYSALLQTLSFNMKDFVMITTDRNDTIYVNDYLFQRTFNMSQANTLLFSFPAEKIRTAQLVRLHVREFGLSIGNIIFDFKTKNILDTPRVEWNDL